MTAEKVIKDFIEWATTTPPIFVDVRDYNKFAIILKNAIAVDSKGPRIGESIDRVVKKYKIKPIKKSKRISKYL